MYRVLRKHRSISQSDYYRDHRDRLEWVEWVCWARAVTKVNNPYSTACATCLHGYVLYTVQL